MKIIYIPFFLDDTLSDLDILASQWIKQYQVLGKKAPIKLVHGLKIPIEVKEAIETGNAKIYVIGHGLDTPDFVISNQAEVDDLSLDISIETVAERFSFDFKEINFHKENIVKLYFCDTYAKDDKAENMAKKFASSLGDKYDGVDVQYYTDVSVGLISVKEETSSFSKMANREIKLINSIVMVDLWVNAGSPKQFRKSIHENAYKEQGFFAKPSYKPIFPDYEHPMIKQLAKMIVGKVMADPIIKDKQLVVEQFFAFFPTKIQDFLVNKIKIQTHQFFLTLLLNKEILMEYLGDKVEEKVPAVNEVFEENEGSWVDEADFLPREELNEALQILPLEDFNEVEEKLVSELEGSLKLDKF